MRVASFILVALFAAACGGFAGHFALAEKWMEFWVSAGGAGLLLLMACCIADEYDKRPPGRSCGKKA